MEVRLQDMQAPRIGLIFLLSRFQAIAPAALLTEPLLLLCPWPHSSRVLWAMICCLTPATYIHRMFVLSRAIGSKGGRRDSAGETPVNYLRTHIASYLPCGSVYLKAPQGSLQGSDDLSKKKSWSRLGLHRSTSPWPTIDMWTAVSFPPHRVVFMDVALSIYY